MAKQTPLVSQYLENISRDALEKYQDIIKDYVSHQQGLYALYKDDKIYYVGLASNLRSRLSRHLRDRHGELWDRFSVYLTINSSHMKELETLFLRISMPKGNKIRGKFQKAESLRRKLNADIKKKQELERGLIFGKKVEKKKDGSGKRKLKRKRRRTSDIKFSHNLKGIDTIVVPAREDGFQETFINENRWYSIRIRSKKIPRLKYIAVYRVAPESAITHIAPIKNIEKWRRTDKYVVNFSKPAKKLTPIKLVPKGVVKPPYSPRYTTVERIKKAKTLDDVF